MNYAESEVPTDRFDPLYHFLVELKVHGGVNFIREKIRASFSLGRKSCQILFKRHILMMLSTNSRERFDQSRINSYGFTFNDT